MEELAGVEEVAGAEEERTEEGVEALVKEDEAEMSHQIGNRVQTNPVTSVDSLATLSVSSALRSLKGKRKGRLRRREELCWLLP